MTHLLRSFLRWPLNLGPLALIVLAAAAIFALPGSTQGGPAPDLLAPTGGEVAFDGENIISRSRTVDINLGLLDTAADTFTFNFFDDAAFPVTFTDRYESPVGYTLTGTVEGFPLSTASMAVNGDTLTANVKINGAWYGIRHTGDSHVAQEFNEAAFPLDHPQDVPQWTAAPGAPAADVPEPQATVQLDVLVVYTRAARDAAGGKSSIENIAALAATETTNAYAKSGINAKLNLVHVEEVSYTESDGDAFSDALLDITYSDGFGYPEMDQVFDLRDEYHADFVALLIDDSQYCGVAWLNNNPESLGFADVAYSVTAWNCATGYYSFGHEIGHNQGMRHDWYVDGSTIPFEYAHGYVNTPGKWRTVLAYNSECFAQGFNCTRIDHFSNPNVNYSGAPTGIPEGQPNPSENFRVANEHLAVYAQYRDPGVLYNPGFEYPVTDSNWTLIASGGGDGRLNYSGAAQGASLLLLNANGATELIRQTLAISGGSGDSYVLEMQVGGQNVTGGQIGAQIEFLSGADTVDTATCLFTDRGTFNWRTFTCDANPDGAYDAIRINIGWRNVSDGKLGLDAVLFGP